MAGVCHSTEPTLKVVNHVNYRTLDLSYQGVTGIRDRDQHGTRERQRHGGIQVNRGPYIRTVSYTSMYAPLQTRAVDAIRSFTRRANPLPGVR